jgi:hypothetical protein
MKEEQKRAQEELMQQMEGRWSLLYDDAWEI